MDMDYADPYRQRYHEMTMQPYTGQQPPHHQGVQYPYWNPLMAYYQQQQRAAALMGQGSMHLSKPAEPKPRLAKDEVDLLEREFAKNQKPSSSTKRELAEQMGVEVPRINNWFQNRRAKEKQMRKTAEFEAQQARERAASESDSVGSQDPSVADEFDDAGKQSVSPSPSDAGSAGEDSFHESDDFAPKMEPVDHPADAAQRAAPAGDSLTRPNGDGFLHVDYALRQPAAHAIPELVTPVGIMGAFDEIQSQNNFQPPATFAFRLSETNHMDATSQSNFDALTPRNGVVMNSAAAFGAFGEPDYFTTPSASQFPSEMMAAGTPLDSETPLLRHQPSIDSLVQSDAVSPISMPESPSTLANLRFRSPPPPANIASRRKSRRPAPLGLSSIRGGPGPKTGMDSPRRADTVSPMRRISSATGSLCGRVQKTFLGPGGPRSPFAMDRNKEALLQSVQENQTPNMASLNSAMSPISPGGVLGSGMGDCAVAAHSPKDDHSYPYGSMAPVGGAHFYANADSAVRSPPGTPGFPMGFQDGYFPTSFDHSWNYVQQDESLPTPSLCSHGGSELEFSMAPRLPGYVASQPVTPSFPPSMGPTYTGYFGTSLGPTEYHFPDSYPTESSARSSPVAPPRSKQFQFAQNITPQDFSTDKS